MSLDQWLLSLHVVSAALLVAGMVLFWVLIVSGRNIDTPEDTLRVGPIAKVGNAAVGIGMGGTIILGVALAFSYGDYDIWDGWIIAALVLWLIAAELGRRTGAEYMKAATRAQELQAGGQSGSSGELLALNRTSKGLLLHALTSVAVALIVIDMIWKPGA